MPPAERARGLITYSSGNHAQGVARAARLLGVPAAIVMPSDAPAVKRARVEADGAQVVVVGPASDERRRVAEEIAASRGLAIIPPYDDPRIIAGQGTVGLEIAEDLPDVAVVLVPIGGGGLAAGVAAAIRALAPDARVIGVEPELAADARDSLAQDRIVAWSADQVGRTIADGTRTQSIGRLNFAHLRVQLDAVITVSELEIAAAVRLAAEEARLVVEPSGALVIAAMRFHAAEAGPPRRARTRHVTASSASSSRRQRRPPSAYPRVPASVGPPLDHRADRPSARATADPRPAAETRRHPACRAG